MATLFRYPLSHIRQALQGVQETVSVVASVLDPQLESMGLDVEKKEEIKVDIAIRMLDKEQVEAKGNLSARLTFACQRCLEPAVIEVEQPWLFYFFPPGGTLPHSAARRDAKDVLESDEVDPEALHHDREQIDLGIPLREQLLLALPMIPVCKEDCLGLCQVCGENRNLVTCLCAPNQKKSPFASLREMV